MKHIKKFIFLHISLLLLCPCYSNPEKRPEDFKISYMHMNGRLPTTNVEKIIISKSSSYFKKQYNGLTYESHFSISDKDFDELYTKLKKNNFDKMTSDFSKTMDRGGTEIIFSWNDKSIMIKNFGSYFIKKEWEKNWLTVQKDINEFVSKDLEKYKRTIQLIIKINQKKERLIMFYLNDSMIYGNRFKPGKDYITITKEIRCLPGKYYFEIYSNDKSLIKRELIDLTNIKKINIIIQDTTINLVVVK